MKKYLLTLSILLSVSPLFAYRQLVIFNPANSRVVSAYLNGNFDPPAFQGRTDVDFDPDLSQVENIVNQKYWKRQSPGMYVPMTAPEIAALDALEVAASTASVTSSALDKVDAFDEVSLAERGFALVSLDEINTLRQWLAGLKAAVAACATCPAGFKNDVAALPATPDRTKTQLKNAVKAKISSGGAD